MPEPGPLFWFRSIGGEESPFYALRFDKFGELSSPRTAEELVDRLEKGEFTDVIVCSHGWNNVWKDALANYRHFLECLGDISERTGLRPDRAYKPLVIGVFWPATSLVLPWEKGPAIAGGVPGGSDSPDLDAWEVGDTETIAELIAEDDLAEFYRLAEAKSLDTADAARLADLLLPLTERGDSDLHEMGPEGTAGRADLLAGWQEYATSERPTGVAPGRGGRRLPADEEIDIQSGQHAGSAPLLAGRVSLDPRIVLRLTTVRIMKDRAGKVGARGVGDILRRCMTAAPSARIHLVGHSYGCRVLLNAVARPVRGELPGRIRSMLLLQPAVSHLCFADALPQLEGSPPGGYRAVLGKVDQPILSTMSKHDFPLRKVFHHALIRPKDLGDILIAGDDDPPPNIYAALGGYGPRRFTVAKVTMKEPHGAPAPEDFYDLSPDAPRVVTVEGTANIPGHGDVVSTASAWALLNLLLVD